MTEVLVYGAMALFMGYLSIQLSDLHEAIDELDETVFKLEFELYERRRLSQKDQAHDVDSVPNADIEEG